MADKKDLNNLKNKNLGKGAGSLNFGQNSNINQLLNKNSQGYGYGGAKPPTPPTQPGGIRQTTPQSPFGPRPTGPTPPPTQSPFGPRPQSPGAPSPFGQGSQPQGPFGPRPTFPGQQSPFGSPFQPGGSTLQNLRQGSFGAPQGPQVPQGQQIPTYKTPKQLREELKQRKKQQKLIQKGQIPPQQTMPQQQVGMPFGQQIGGIQFGNRFGGQFGGQFGGLQQRQPLSPGDFFKQLQQMKQTAVADPDAQYADEKEQEIIKQLERIKEGQVGAKEETKKKRGGWFWVIILSIILVAVAVAGIILYNTLSPQEYEYVRISVQMTNPDQVFYYTGVNGEKIPVKINPGDSFDLRVIARNSKNVLGDTDAPVWKPIFVRFKVWLAIDGVEQQNLVEIKPNSNQWIRYNKEIEDTYLNDQGMPIVSIDDGYYYYKGMLQPNQQVTLFDNIKFSFNEITEEIGGKKATLFVQVEVLEEALAISAYWVNAPQQWVRYIKGEE